MPLATSGVMLLEYTVPKGVSMARPPANGAPPIAVWHAMQSPATTRYRPRPASMDEPEGADTGDSLSRAASTLPHSSGNLRGALARFVPAGTGCAASHAA